MARTKDKKAALIAAAKELFSTQGYQHTTVQAITAAAGVATGSFYSYFSSKEACFLALTEILYEALLTEVLAARHGVQDSLVKLERSLAAAVDVFLRDPALSRTVLIQADSSHPLLGARIQEVKTSLIGFLAEDLAEAGIETPTLLAHMLFGALAQALAAYLAESLPETETPRFRSALLAHLSSLLRGAGPSTFQRQ